jgi:putative transposase
MTGLPKTLHLDGAAEFKSKALKRGCSQYGIELVYRERPHHGGHIERLIGTKMSKLKALPGATGGSPKARRSYDPDKYAAMTLGELETWFAQQIVGRYHQEPHRGLKGGTPTGAWALHPSPILPPASLRRFRIDFLPAVVRTLRRDGVVFENLRYWHPIFTQWLARHERLTLHFDPRNLAKLYVQHDGDYLEVPFADVRLPPVSLWEVQAAARHLRQVGRKSINASLLIEAIEKQREIVSSAQAKTRKMRRQQQAAQRGPKSSTIDPLTAPAAQTSAIGIDWSKPAEPFEGEVW